MYFNLFQTQFMLCEKSVWYVLSFYANPKTIAPHLSLNYIVILYKYIVFFFVLVFFAACRGLGRGRGIHF